MYGGREVVVPTTLENPAFAPFADREINGACVRDASGITAGLLPFPEDPQHAVPAIEAKIADIGIARLADPQAVEPEQHREGGTLVPEVL